MGLVAWYRTWLANLVAAYRTGVGAGISAATEERRMDGLEEVRVRRGMSAASERSGPIKLPLRMRWTARIVFR